MLDNVELLNYRTFDEVIEDIVWEIDCSHFEAVLEFCDRNECDVEDVQKLIGKPLKEKLQYDAMKEGYVQRQATLISL